MTHANLTCLEGKTMAKKGGAGKGKQTAEKQLMGEIDSDIDDDELEVRYSYNSLILFLG
jgi:hypothetical protein